MLKTDVYERFKSLPHADTIFYESFLKRTGTRVLTVLKLFGPNFSSYETSFFSGNLVLTTELKT